MSIQQIKLAAVFHIIRPRSDRKLVTAKFKPTGFNIFQNNLRRVDVRLPQKFRRRDELMRRLSRDF